MFKPLLIHNDNTIILDKVTNRLSLKLDEFDFEKSDLDTYITNEIIPILQQKQFNILFIKDNLSQNYIELYGILLSYHIRLSSELEDKRFVPIVILSDVDGYILNKLTPMANVLFTKNTFVVRNEILSYNYFEKFFEQIQPFNDFKKEFLDLIHIDSPQDYLSPHDISNKWSIYRWAEYLDVNTPDIEKIRDEISSMLYFKYLQAKFPIKRSLFAKHKQEIQCKDKCKILFIDDEWEKGWKSIFEHLSLENKNCILETVEEVYKDKSQEEIITFIIKKVMSVDPDVVILDMRLHEDDFLKDKELADFTGIQIFNQIKEINPGIQVIIFTASSNSLLLDELYSYDSSILGYVKKEHPKDYNLTTQGNINKLIGLVNKGFERKFLKDIYIIKREIENELQNDIFVQYGIKLKKYESFWKKIIVEVEAVFDILDSDRGNRFLYATVSIAVSMESILSVFIPNDRKMFFWDKEAYECKYNALRCKINKLFKKLGSNENFDMEVLIKKRNDYIHNEPVVVNQDEIKLWFSKLQKMIEIIKNPPNLKLYDKNDIINNLKNNFQNR